MKEATHTSMVQTMSKVEAENIKAKTTAIKHSNIINWIRLVVSILVGLIIILIGLVKFLKNPDNSNYLYLIFIGVFLLSTIKPTIDNILNKINI